MGRGAHSVVYRGRYRGQLAAIKVADGDDAPRLFRREAAALAQVRGARAPRPFASGTLQDGRTYLAMEWLAGPSLASRLQARAPLALDEVLRLAREIALILRAVHAAGLVHRDVTPDNVVDADGGFALLDFGLVTRPEAGPGVRSERSLVGTPAYAAPEQTGMLQRPVDGRADLYGLGAVLFHALTGSPPYRAEEVGELIRQHAVAPLPPLDPELPRPLRALLRRLLAKDPDDRFRDADALLAALAPLDSRAPPSLGSVARPSAHGSLLEPLLRRLGAPEAPGVTALCGPPGVGKSDALRCLRDRLLDQGRPALLLDAGAHADAPLSGLRALLTVQLRAAEAGAAAQSARLAEAPQATRRVWALLVPNLTELADDAGAVEGPAVEPHQLAHAVSELWRALAPRGVTVLLDGVESLDAESRRVLWHAAAEGSVRVVCGALPERAPSADEVVTLAPVSVEALRAFAAAVLGEQVGLAEARTLHEQSLGRPGAARRLLDAWLDGGVLGFNEGRWQIDREALQARPLPATVEGVALVRLAQLPDESRDVLRALSVLGRVSPARAVETLSGAREEHLHPAMRAGLLREDGQDGLVFVHEAIRRALYEELDAQARADLHRRAAAWLDGLLDGRGEAPDAWVFAWAEQHRLSADAGSAPAALRAMRAAADRAWATASVPVARRWLQEAGDVARAHELPLDAAFYRATAEACAADGDFEAALAWLDCAADASDDRAEQASLKLRKAHFYMYSLRRMHSARVCCDQAWRLYGRPMPPEAGWTALRALWLLLVIALYGLTGWRRGRRAGDEALRAQVELCEITGIGAVYADRPWTLLYSQARLATYAHLLGDSPEHATMLTHWGNILSLLRAPRAWAAAFFARAEAEAARLDDRAVRARLEHYRVFALPAYDAFAEAERRAAELVQRSLHWLNTADTCGFLFNYGHALQLRGYGLRSLSLLHRALRKLGVDPERCEAVPVAAIDALVWAYALHGEPERAARLMEQVGLEGPDVDPIMWQAHWATRLQACFFTNVFTEADQHLSRWEEARSNPLLAVWNSSHLWLAPALVRHAQLEAADGPARGARLAQLRRAVWLARLSSRSAASDCLVLALRAALAGEGGRRRSARRLLARAERVAQRADAPLGLFLVHHVRAALLSAGGQRHEARLSAEAALDLALRHRWPGLAARARERHGVDDGLALARSHRSASRSITSGTVAAGHDPQARREREALMRVSLATSGNLDLTAQARAALDHLLDIFGAERAVLFDVSPDGRLARSLGRSADRVDLAEQEVIARSLVARVREQGRPLVITGTDEGRALGSQSVVAEDVRSIICAPLRVAEQVRGVIYLDSRLAKGVFTHGDLEVLTAIAGQLAVARQAAAAAQSELARRDLERDLELTATVQHLLLPREDVWDAPPLQLAAHVQPAQRAGGDFWQRFARPDGGLWLLLGDVTGHGADAAMVTAAAVGALRALSGAHEELGPLLRDFHLHARALCRGAYQISMLALDVSPNGQVRIFSAAAPPVLQLRADGSVIAHTIAGSLVGGDGSPPAPRAITLAEGELVICATDGVFELPLPSGRELGPRGLSRLVQALPGGALEAQRDWLAGALRARAADAPQEDDITFLLLRRAAAG